MVLIYCDASTRTYKPEGKHGPGAAAVVAVSDTGRVLLESLRSLPEKHTVNENEYIGLIDAHRIAFSITTFTADRYEFEIVCDSQVVTQQFRGKEEGDPWTQDGTDKPGFTCNAANLKPYLAEARRLYAMLTEKGHTVRVRHLLRSTEPGNSRADYLAQSESDRLTGVTKSRRVVDQPFTEYTGFFHDGFFL